MRLEIIELALARVIVEPAESVDAHDHRDDEQHDRALAAVAVGAFRAAVEPYARAEDQHRRGKLDHAREAHRWIILTPSASVAVVATTSRMMRPTMMR